MRALVDRQIDGAGIAGRELRYGALEHAEFILDILVCTEAHREPSVIEKARARRVRKVDHRDLGRHVAREQLPEDRRKVRDLRRVGVAGVEHLADLRFHRRDAVDTGEAGQFAVRDGLEQLAVLVDDPVAVVRLDVGHGAALLDRNGDAVRQGARDLCFVHIGKLAEDAAGRRETVDEKEVVALADARGVNDLLGRVDGVSDDLDLRDAEKHAHPQHKRHADQQEDQRLQQRSPPPCGRTAHTARTALPGLPGLLRLFHRQRFLSPRRGTAHISAQRRQARVKAVVPAVNIPVVEKLGRALGAKPGHEHGRAAAQVACRERRAGEPLDAGDICHTALDADGCAQTPEFLGMTVAVGKDVFGEHRGALCPQAGRHERRLRIRGKARIWLRDNRARRRELPIR